MPDSAAGGCCGRAQYSDRQIASEAPASEVSRDSEADRAEYRG